MINSESQPQPDSIFSEQTDDSARSDDAILELGQKLVEQLGLEQSVDTLGRWIAHYIADLMVKAESTTGEEKHEVEKKCFDAILALWKHRSELPNGKRPFEDLEPVVRAIESLDPEDNTPRYFRFATPPRRQGEEKNVVDQWIEAVCDLDYSAKILIGYCLAEAAHATVDKAEKWVKLAEAAGVADSAPEIVIRFVLTKADLGKEPDPSAEIRLQLQNRIKRLKSFNRLAEAVAGHLAARLEALPSLEEGDDSVGDSSCP